MRFSRSPRTASRVIDGRAVVINIDADRLFSLNPQATVVWQALERSPTLDEVVVEICRKFEVPVDRARTDCERFIETLRHRELVVCDV